MPVLLAIPYQSQPGEQQHFSTFAAMLDAYYAQMPEQARVLQLRGNQLHELCNELAMHRKCQRKLCRTLVQTEMPEAYRIRGEIQPTYQRLLKRGKPSIALELFYAAKAPICITLSNQQPPSRNAQKYFAC